MSKKKSYMDKNNIISEGFFDTLKKYLVKYPIIRKDKKVKDSIKSLNNDVKELEKLLNKRFKELDPKHKSIKLSKYKSTDFI